MNHSDSITKVCQALFRAEQAFHPTLKTSVNPHFKSKYADLASVFESCRDALTAEGLLIVQTNAPSEGSTLEIITSLVHVESGEFLSSHLTLPLPKADPQGVGSAMTYGRRYALCALLGIAPEDDDGNAGSKTPDQKPSTSGDMMPKAKPPQAPVLPAQNAPQSRQDAPGATKIAALTDHPGPAGVSWIRHEVRFDDGRVGSIFSDNAKKSTCDRVSELRGLWMQEKSLRPDIQPNKKGKGFDLVGWEVVS